jgi:hypothetical protein
MKIRPLYFMLVFTVVLFIGLSRTQASPVSLGNASRFAALALDGTASTTGGVTINSGSATITGPVGVASSGSSFTGQSGFTSDLYVNTGSTITLNGATPSSVNQNASTDSFLSQAITDANNASAAATAKGPGTNLGNITSNQTLTNAAVGNYVYTIGNISAGTTINISAPAGSTVIVNITGTIGQNLDLNIAGGLTANDVVYNVTMPDQILDVSAGGTSITGILLAPTSTVTLGGHALVTGQVIAKSIVVGGTSDIIFSGPVTPEPSSLSVVAIGTVALLGCRFFRRWKSSG